MLKNKRLFYALSVLSGVTIAGIIHYFGKGQRIKRLTTLTLGIKEIGNNQGYSSELFTKMMKSVGWKSTESWCMFYAKSIYMYSLPKLKKGISELSGLVQSNYNKAKADKLSIFKLVTDSKPIIGDIVLWLRGDGTGHAGVVTKVYDNSIEVTEGNTNYIKAPKNPTDSVVRQKHDKKIGSGYSKGSKLKLAGYLRLK